MVGVVNWHYFCLNKLEADLLSKGVTLSWKVRGNLCSVTNEGTTCS